MDIVAPPIDDKEMTKFLEEKVLPHIDELYRAMVQHQPSLKTDDGRRKGLFFLPSLRAITPFEAKAKNRGEFIREIDWDRNRDAEVAVWRAMDDLDATETEREGAGGYWVKTDVLDMYPWEEMKFV